MSDLVTMVVARGDVVWVDLSGARGAEKQKKRPCVVVQNDTGNSRSPLTVVVPLTDSKAWRQYPMQVLVPEAELGEAFKDSVADCGHIRSVDKAHRLDSSLGVVARLSAETMRRIDDALRATLGLSAPPVGEGWQ